MKETATEEKAIVGVFLLTVSYFLEASIFRRIFSFLASRFLSNILFPRIFTCLSVTYLSIKRTPLYGGQLEEKKKTVISRKTSRNVGIKFPILRFHLFSPGVQLHSHVIWFKPFST